MPLLTMLGGTSILIMVGVALETMTQLESQLKMRHYDGFFKYGASQGVSPWGGARSNRVPPGVTSATEC